MTILQLQISCSITQCCQKVSPELLCKRIINRNSVRIMRSWISVPFMDFGIIWILFAIFADFSQKEDICTRVFFKYCGNSAFCSFRLNGIGKDHERTKRLNKRIGGGNWGWFGWTVVVWISLWNFVIWIIGIYGFVEILAGNLRNKNVK